MPLKIVCTGDIHLGRAPSRIPNDARLIELCSPREALRKTVEFAKEVRADLLLLTGDIADHDNAFFEAHEALSRSLRELSNANIPVYAVSGNHDFELLPALAREIPGFTVLGADGGWQEVLFPTNGTPQLRLIGRSFRGKHERENALADYRDPCGKLPALGMLHCDVDSFSSEYRPVALADLKLKVQAGWLLGHVHKPQVFQTDPLIMYPGSLQALDPGETGAHGPWLLEFDNGRFATVRQQPLAALRYEEFEIDVTSAGRMADVQSAILEHLKNWQQANSRDLKDVAAISCRLRLTARSGMVRELTELAQRLEADDCLLLEKFYIDRVRPECAPELPLEALAGPSDPPGILAGILEELASEGGSRVLRAVQERLDQVRAEYAFFGVASAERLEGSQGSEVLRRAGLRLLEELLSQRRRTA